MKWGLEEVMSGGVRSTNLIPLTSDRGFQQYEFIVEPWNSPTRAEQKPIP